MYTLNEQILDDLTSFLIKYEMSVYPELLRSKLRFLHKNLSQGILKSQVRGILNMFTRWSAEKIITDIFEIIQKSSQNRLRNLSQIKPDLLSREFLLRINTGETLRIFNKNETKLKLEIKTENTENN
jgi:hypothetical protein